MGILRAGDGKARGIAEAAASVATGFGESGTELARRAPPDAVQNCLRSNAKFLDRSFTSVSAAANLVGATTGRHYTTEEGRHKLQNRFFSTETAVPRSQKMADRPPKRTKPWYELSYQRATGLISLSGGTELADVSTRSGTGFPRNIPSTSISMAWPALGGTKIVAASIPLRTQACPVFGKPSQPVNGSFNQRSRSASLGNSSKALRAPMAMESSCAPIASMKAFCEVVSFIQDRTARCELSSVHWPFKVVTEILAGLVSSIPAVRSFAAEFSEGPWI